MALDDLKSVWQSAANSPSAAEVDQIRSTFANGLRRRRRLFVCFLAWVFGALTCCTGMVVYSMFIVHKVSLKTEWAIIPMLAIPWVFAINFLAQSLRHNRENSNYAASISESLKAALDGNRVALSRAKQIGLLHLLVVPGLVLVVHQMHGTGKMNEYEIVSMLVAFGIALAISVGCNFLYYYRKLLPQRREIESLLRLYEPDPD